MAATRALTRCDPFNVIRILLPVCSRSTILVVGLPSSTSRVSSEADAEAADAVTTAPESAALDLDFTSGRAGGIGACHVLAC